MDEAVLKQARECRFCQAALRELAGHLPSSDDALDPLLAQAVADRDELAFTHLLLAALDAGRRVDARHLIEGAELFPKTNLLATAVFHVSGDAGEALVEAVDRGAIGYEWEGFALLLAGLWCRKHRDGNWPAGLIPRARILARKSPGVVFSQIQLASLYQLTQDTALKTILDSTGFPFSAATAQKCIDDFLLESELPVFQNVPETPGPLVLSGYTVRRAVARVGRNDPCPCGSGQKYKKCCLDKDQERLTHSSAIPGLTVEELRECAERYLTRDRILEMRSYELARLDPVKIAPALLPVLINRLLSFEQVEAVVRLFETVPFQRELDGHWDDAVWRATSISRRDLVQRLLQLEAYRNLMTDKLDLGTRILLVNESANPVLDLIEAEALQALKSNDVIGLVELAYALLASRLPALGILVARSVVPIAGHFDATVLFDALLETRDKLNLNPDDPFEEILDQRFYEEPPGDAKSSQALAEAQHHLEEKSHQVRLLKNELDSLHKEIDRQEKRRPAKLPRLSPLPPSETPVDPQAMTELRQRVNTLKETLKERHSERNQLRRDLQKALQDLESLRQKNPVPPVESVAVMDDDEDDLLLAEEPLSGQPVRLPEFPKKFTEILKSLPKQVARATLTLIGRLAAGDSGAFVGAKRLKANHEIVRQRVGAAYRLLFRLKPEVIEVVALIHRRDLDLKIKTLG